MKDSELRWCRYGSGEFEWLEHASVFVDGKRNRELDGPALVCRPFGLILPPRQYDFFEQTKAAFLDVANALADAEGLRDIVERFGPLHADKHSGPVVRSPQKDVAAWWPAMLVSRWTGLRSDIRLALSLWFAVDTQDEGALAAVESGWNIELEPTRGLSITPQLDSGRLHLARLIQWNLRKLHVEMSPATLSLTHAARSLSDGIWLQLQRAIAAGRHFAECEVCGCWFERKRTDTARGQRFCSPACRQRAFVARRREAAS